MEILQYLMIYLLVGSLCGFCIEFIMDRTELNDDTTLGERILWVVLWPVFILAFLWGISKDDE